MPRELGGEKLRNCLTKMHVKKCLYLNIHMYTYTYAN